MHNARPCKIIWCENRIHRSRGRIFTRSCSIFTGSVFFVRSSRCEIRITCVSTTTPLAIPYADPSTTFAVFRAAPGTVSSSSIVRGTTPPNSPTTRCAAPTIDFALLLKNPVLRISFAKTSGRTAAKSSGVGYFRNSPGVTSFTRLSVHCAERIVATSNSHGFRCNSAHSAFGYVRSSTARISASRSLRSAAVFGRFT